MIYKKTEKEILKKIVEQLPFFMPFNNLFFFALPKARNLPSI